jgi:putative mRNA 3-end processing factor
MKFTFLGGAGEVGRSAVLVETDNKRFMIDYGIKVMDMGPAELPLVPNKKINEIVISHGHLDHIGFLPMLYENNQIPWYATSPTGALAELLIADAMKVHKLNGFENPYTKESFIRSLENFYPLEYNEPFKMRCGAELILHDAGHILGASMCEFNIEKKKVIYTGDYNFQENEMHKGAKYDTDIDILITESTYAEKEHPPREEEIKRMIENIKYAINRGGCALVPVFAVGRTQEVMSILIDNFDDVPIYLDGMSVKSTDIYLRFPKYIKNPRKLHDAMYYVKVPKKNYHREKALKGGCIIVCPAGMLSGGWALWYLQRLPHYSTVTITGFCAEGTNGRRLLEKGSIIVEGKEKEIKFKTIKVDFSAHVGRTEIFDMIKKSTPELVVCMHGDNCFTFADELRDMGFEAIAPRMGETIPVK